MLNIWKKLNIEKKLGLLVFLNKKPYKKKTLNFFYLYFYP